jgi:DNA polymerase-3 subunit gamma/tau
MSFVAKEPGRRFLSVHFLCRQRKWTTIDKPGAYWYNTSTMSQTLYRKYRPQKFSEIIGQKHIVQTLSNAIKNNHIGQAYLFTGPRGTGKTTMARLFAKAVNCANLVSEERAETKLSIRRSSPQRTKADTIFAEPCGQCAICKNIAEGRSLDIIEIDAASNTGVDNIRELRETINLPPTQAKYKVYIIDEVHMLSSGAFNALLKTLEEPPAHVIFILATTEIHKVPDTILSRVQRFDFARLPLENIIQKLSAIAEKEGVKVEKEALEMIALGAEGGMRDAESLLAQVITLEDKNITAKEVAEILGTSDHQLIEQMAGLLVDGQTSAGLVLLNQIASDGFDLDVFCKSLLNYLRQLLIVSVDPALVKTFTFELTGEQMEKVKALAQKGETKKILILINAFLEAKAKIKSSFIPQLPLEIAIVQSTGRGAFDLPQTAPVAQAPRSNPQPVAQAAPAQASTPQPAKSNQHEPEAIEPESKLGLIQSFNNGKIIEIFDIRKKWNDVLSAIKPLNHSLILFLSNCQPVSIQNNQLTIATQYAFYKDKLNEHANKLTIETEFARIFEAKIKVIFTDEGYEVGNEIKFSETPKPQSDPADPLMGEAMKLFGGKIVQE